MLTPTCSVKAPATTARYTVHKSLCIMIITYNYECNDTKGVSHVARVYFSVKMFVILGESLPTLRLINVTSDRNSKVGWSIFTGLSIRAKQRCTIQLEADRVFALTEGQGSCTCARHRRIQQSLLRLWDPHRLQ